MIHIDPDHHNVFAFEFFADSRHHSPPTQMSTFIDDLFLKDNQSINQFQLSPVSSFSKIECELVLLLTAILETMALKFSVLRLKDKETISQSVIICLHNN
jgi:hypothetical protein